MPGVGRRHVVRAGDSLWTLAERHLGDARAWPRICEHNNDPRVVALTRTRIADPNLIFVGQTIYLPEGQSSRSAGRPAPGCSPTSFPPPSARPGFRPPAGESRPRPAARGARGVPLKYDLQRLPSVTVYCPGFVAVVKLTGSITLQPTRSIDFATFVAPGNTFEVSSKNEADLALGRMVQETKIGYNPTTHDIVFENGITLGSSIPFVPSVSFASALSSQGLPCIKVSMASAPLRGRWGAHAFQTTQLGIAIELTPAPPAPPRLTPTPSARPGYQGERAPVHTPSTRVPSLPEWVVLGGALLIVGAGVVVIASVAADVLTLGASVPANAATFAAAAAMFTVGVGYLTEGQVVSSGRPISFGSSGVPDA